MSDPAAAPPVLTEHYAAYRVGKVLCVTTSHGVRLITGISSGKEADPDLRDLTLPAGLDLVLLARSVTIHGRLEAPGRNVTIITRTLKTVIDSTATADRQRAAINVSGTAGTSGDPAQADPCKALASPPAAQGYKADRSGNDGTTPNQAKSGTDGMPGGHIKIICGSTAHGFDLELQAAGGAGGSGQNGQDGQPGGTGKTGRDGTPGGMFTNGIPPEKGGDGGSGGQGGQGGNAGQGGEGGKIFFRAIDHSSQLPRVAEDPCAGGKTGSPGAGGMGGAGGKFGKGGAGYLIPGTAGNYGGGNKTPDAANGSTGQDHSKTRANSGQVNRCEPPTTPPLTATAGTVDIKPSVRAPDGSTGFDPASAGVVRDHWFDLQAYLEMELQRARFAYLSMRVPVDAVTSDEDSAKAMVDASERLRWTLDLAKAALTPPSGGVAQSATDQEAVTYLKNLYARASALKERMDNGLDYFNHFPDWNPTLTLGYYERELGVASPETGGALYDYKKAEQDCLAAHEKLISVRDTAAARKQASALAVAQVNAYGVFIENSQAVRETLLQKIAAEQKEVEALHDELVTKIDDWTKEVEEQKSGLELRHVFEALSQFAFFPEGEGALVMFKQASMVIGQSGSVLTSAATPAPQEKWLLDQLAIAKHDVDALDESFRNAARGTIVLDDPNGSLILGERRTFDQLCGRFANESQGARDAMGSMDRYAETILKRNQTILRYNEVVNRIHAALAERDTAKHMLDSVRDAQAQADGSDLGIAAAQLGLALFQRKEECLRLLYEASRAYSLVTLQPDLTFHETVGLANPYDINAKTVRDAAATLVTQRRVNIDPMFPQQHLPVETGPSVVEEFGRAGGVRLTLKRGTTPLLFEGLTKGTGSVRFDVDELTNEPNAPFAEKLNVRIRAVRCWLHDLRGPGGAPDKAPAVYRVVLQHQGDSSFLTKDGIPVTRNHDPVSVDFSYDRSRSGDNDSYHGIYARDLRGVKDGILTADNHMLLSPFATWRIDLPDVAAGLADASGLDEIRFEFFLSYDTRIKPKK